MIRTRKRDDDSQYNNSITSDGTTTSLAFDASSMSATGSRSTFASSSKRQHQQQQQPRRKRRRKTLSDALQSISLDHQDVPDQILKKFPFRKSVSFHQQDSPWNWTYHNDLNSQQRIDRQIQLGQDRGIATGGDGDIYYDDYDDDDNSQLTTSSAENDTCVVTMDDEDDEDDESPVKPLTKLEKAQRKVMFELVFGKGHRETKRALGATTTPPIHPSALSSPPPIQSKPLLKESSSPSSSSKDSSRDPVDRKIEELMRQSLKNLQKGSHPLALPKLQKDDDNDDDDEDLVTTPWKTQDDMAVDPEIYSRVSPIGIPSANSVADQLPLQQGPFARKRSNSLPGGLASFGMVDTADMEE